jgi:PAS domain S-box-containing protein
LEQWLPIRDSRGEPIGLSIVVEETTERKQAELALRESEERYHSLFDNASDSIFIFDPDSGSILDLNPTAADHLGYSRSELLEKNYRFFHEETDFSRVERLIKAAVPGATVEDEHVHRSKNGEARTIEMKGRIIEINGKKVFQSISRDVTDRNHMVQALRRYADELAVSNQELESFSYSIAHDLRAPLRAMKGFSDLIIEDYSGSMDKDMKAYFDRIIKSADKMDELITDMLSLSKITRQEMNPSDVDLSATAGSIVDELRHAQPARKVDVLIAEGIRGNCDERLMRIALSNLIGNSWKYTGKTNDARIEFGIEEVDGKKRYYVRDNGDGFDMARAEGLFAPFKRLHSDSQFPGTGIGLAIVKRVFQRHHGRIWAESEPGKGATFYFTIG